MLQPAAARADDADRFLSRGVFLDGRLWLLTDRGSLFSIHERTRRRTDADLPEDVLDICRRDDQLLAVTGDRYGGSWAVRRLDRGRWNVVAEVHGLSGEPEDMLAMDCGSEAPVTLLTTGRLIELRPGGASAVRLSEMIYARVNLTTLATREHLYVGLNSGEWGGGMLRVERGTGRVSGLGRSARWDECGDAVLCEPVYGIVPLPWRPDCFAAAAGLVHFFPHGQIAKICGDAVETLYSRTIPRGDGGDPAEDVTTDAFFGVAQSGHTLLAAGVDGLYRIGVNGLIQSSPYPAFRNVRGVRLSFARPDVILVVTEINRRASVSPGAPMMIPR